MQQLVATLLGEEGRVLDEVDESTIIFRSFLFLFYQTMAFPFVSGATRSHESAL